MPRGIRETQFFVVEESPKAPKPGKTVKPLIKTFDSMPKFKEWVASAALTLTKQTKTVMWLEFPDGRFALAFKGYSVACINGKVLT